MCTLVGALKGIKYFFQFDWKLRPCPEGPNFARIVSRVYARCLWTRCIGAYQFIHTRVDEVQGAKTSRLQASRVYARDDSREIRPFWTRSKISKLKTTIVWVCLRDYGRKRKFLWSDFPHQIKQTLFKTFFIGRHLLAIFGCLVKKKHPVYWVQPLGLATTPRTADNFT